MVLNNTQQNLVQLYVNTVDCNGIAVFNLSASAVFGVTNNRVQILNQIAGINLVVINLSGLSVSLDASMDNNVGWLSSTSGLAGTIWNFYQADSLEFSSTTYGGILAPLASVTSNNQVLNGVFVINSFSTQSEVHHPYINFPPSLTRCE
jgi:choice-of-anchor A domain-containing protein